MQEKLMQNEPLVVDVTDADFEQTVIEESMRRPVVVDLWASWCAPCRTLGPILEKAVEGRGGEVLLAKLDVDANPYTSGQFRVQSIPTVLGFVGGKLVDGFVGAVPEPVVNEFLDRLVPSEADRAAAEALAEEEAGDLADAEVRYREALAADPDNAPARLGLGRLLAERGSLDEARELVTPLLPDPDAERIMSAIRVAGWGELGEPGTLASAKRLAAQGRIREALDGMIDSLADDQEAARAAMVDVFALLGDEDELVIEFRRKLANALF
jgi:putative thioredoxin